MYRRSMYLSHNIQLCYYHDHLLPYNDHKLELQYLLTHIPQEHVRRHLPHIAHLGYLKCCTPNVFKLSFS